MEKQNLISLRSVILESKNIRMERGEDFFENKKSLTVDYTSMETLKKMILQKYVNHMQSLHSSLANMIKKF